jgi:hypothetical protein
VIRKFCLPPPLFARERGRLRKRKINNNKLCRLFFDKVAGVKIKKVNTSTGKIKLEMRRKTTRKKD